MNLGAKALIFGLSTAAILASGAAEARHRASHHHHYRHYAYAGARVIQCVAFAKWDTGIALSGNARDWWGRAAGVYARGSAPEEGSVLAFRPVGRMPLGHVAVVSKVVDSRTLLIDQSHWASRGISRDVEVRDVSENNDWSAVRVALSRGGTFGSIYPTHGFIYPRPETGDTLREAVRDAVSRVSHRTLEVAEAPATGKLSRPVDFTVSGAIVP